MKAVSTTHLPDLLLLKYPSSRCATELMAKLSEKMKNENEVRDNEEHIDFFDVFASPVQETDEWGNPATHVSKAYQQDDDSRNNEDE
jgi:hypothetical protein